MSEYLGKIEHWVPALIVVAAGLYTGVISAGSNCPSFLAGGAGADVSAS